MTLHFTKMQGAGNDFVVIDATKEPMNLSAQQIRLLGDRHFGVGFDQMLVVEASNESGVDFRYRIFNADGREVEQCGNGARCFVRFVHEKGLTDKTEIRVRTATGVITPRLMPDGTVTVNMGVPRFAPADIPFQAERAAVSYELTLAEGSVTVSVASMGNPHAVLVVEDVDAALVLLLGLEIQRLAQFPEGVNVGFMQIVSAHAIKLRVFERGAGETLACGTGACAAAISGIRLGLLQSPVQVTARGGELTIAWAGEGEPVLMTGPAVTVFEGEWTFTQVASSS